MAVIGKPNEAIIVINGRIVAKGAAVEFTVGPARWVAHEMRSVEPVEITVRLIQTSLVESFLLFEDKPKKAKRKNKSRKAKVRLPRRGDPKR